jgi:FlaA1/EpsC-like NDP-sugar epimerase
MNLDELSYLPTGRHASMFNADYCSIESQLAEDLAGARVLVIGGAGSIGSSTVKLLARFETAALHVVDHSENALVELVRDLRASPRVVRCSDLRFLPLDFGSAVMRRFLFEQEKYDYVLNFAAVKHVRSEKDVCSALRMLDTNVVKQADLLCWLRERQLRRYFSVSTDKAANPVNLMGATKRLMEHVIFSRAQIPTDFVVTSARFANVAFSNGSLLEGWVHRLAKSQPVAVPALTKRFFVSLEEAGQICAIAAFALHDRQIAVPRLAADVDLRSLDTVAAEFLRSSGYEPVVYTDTQLAANQVAAEQAGGRYPLLLTPLDTSGEKPFEEFIGAGEHPVELGLSSLIAVPYAPRVGHTALAKLVDEIRSLIHDPRRPITKAALIQAISVVVPEFVHLETGVSLDERL